MNAHDDQLDQAAAYVLGALDPDEVSVFSEHLRDCLTCQQEVIELKSVVDVLPLATTVVEAPPQLRSSIIATVQPTAPAVVAAPVPAKRRWNLGLWLPLAPLAAAGVVAVALLVWNLRLQNQVQQQQSALAFQQRVEAALTQGANVSVIPGTVSAPAAHAALIRPQHGHAYLIVQKLPPTPSRRVYQLWLLRGSAPVGAGTFTYAGGNTAVVTVARPAAGYTAAAVTIEPGPRGRPSPTGKKVLLGTLRA